MGKTGATGLTRLSNATWYTLKGLRAAWLNEEAFRQEVLMVAVSLPLALWLAQTWVQFALLFATGLLVVIVELINSALEAVVDRISDERHELSGRAKDMGSAAVFVSLALMAVVWLAVLAERLTS